jgi:hypothetical protein
MDKHGYVSGYANILGNKDKRHPLVIEDHVSLFRSTVGTQWQYQKFLQNFAISTGAKKLNTAGIGDQATAYISSSSVGGLYTMSLGQVYFRRGTYAIRIFIQNVGSLKAADLLQLARTQDARVKG